MEDILEQLKRRKVSNPRQHRRERSLQVRMSTSSKKTVQTEVLDTEEDADFDAFNNIMSHNHHMHHQQIQEEAEKDVMSEVQKKTTLSELNEHK